MSSVYTKILRNSAIVALVATLVAPSFFMAAKPAEAQAGLLGCIAGALGTVLAEEAIGIALGVAFAVPKAPVFVPVAVMGDLSTTPTTGQVSGTTRASAMMSGGTAFKECVLDPLQWIFKQVIIEQLTASIISWINSGFEGGPTFITDPFGFFMNMGDIIAGEYIAAGGLDFLCSPFKLEVQLALIFEYYNKQQSQDNAHCTLSSIGTNVQNFFGGVFDQTEGWDQWFEMVTKPGNDPMGAYLHAEAELSARIRSKTGEEINLLGWADGAFSIRDGNGDVITPGSYINNQLNEVTTRAGIGQLQIADELDEIIGALMGQLSEMLLSGGLFNATSPNPGGVNPASLVQQIRNGSNPANLAANLQARIATVRADAVAAGNVADVAELDALSAQVTAVVNSAQTDAEKATQLNNISAQVETIASNYISGGVAGGGGAGGGAGGGGAGGIGGSAPPPPPPPPPLP